MPKRLKWGTIEYLNTLVDEYFEVTQIPNIAGLCLYLKIGKDCWQYYLTERWRLRRKSPEETEIIAAEMAIRPENDAFEDVLEIYEQSIVANDSVENDYIKEQVSVAIKNAALRLERFVVDAMFNNKNPAGPIFYAKAALGYRETTPEESAAAQQLPTKIVINILPPQQQPVQIVDVTPKTITD